ncbi:efflux RND transporter periplasmic adaptor subunit [Rhizobium sp. BK418]|uniref:efflux RND transporter periplasmic adaptor subunit n=1 Tax=Rhizobium sp. BK418 TaxID=2512120 RepID=UPI00105353F3|nr:efflux RND transporter periplasmic adaptor subunit [Rhizobium sp. BK418]TCS09153.1 membrane fusion protein (multidrug efflux system) [Rhizobium sp. BK418]
MLRNTKLPRLKAMMAATTLLALTAGQTFAQEGGMQMPPAAVGVVEMKAHAVPVVNELPGRIAATRVSEVRARVSGILQERVFQQGTLVKEGDVLYRIDPRLFQVRVASAEAALQRAKATQQNARLQLERQQSLKERNIATGVDYDTAAVNLAQADADVASAQAGLDEAKINLDYTEVRAPITGIIGAALVTEGALVTADGTSNLALIQQIDPVYADFTQSAQDLLNLKRAVAEGKLASAAPGEARVELVFDDGSLYAEPGRLLFASANVDPNTGQVTLRAEFPNKHGDLLPGMYVRVRIEQAVRQDALTVPQRAVIRNEAGQAQVYVLSEGNKAELRSVTLGQTLDSEWVVEQGLKDGEKVIADGVQKVKPGATVAPEPWKPDAPADTSATPDASAPKKPAE